MSTSLDIYPFHEVQKNILVNQIKYFFHGLTGLSNLFIDVGVHNENNDGKMRWLEAHEIIGLSSKKIWHSIWEKNHIKTGVIIDIIDASFFVENYTNHPLPLLTISEIHLRETPSLILQLCAACGIAKAMNNNFVMHAGDFNWLVGSHKISPYTIYTDEQAQNGYVNENDIPLASVESIFCREKYSSLDLAVNNFFKRHPLISAQN